MTKRLRADMAEFVCFKTDGDIEELTEFLSRVRYAGHDTDWMDRELADFTRLRNADIHTLPELRCALRELLPLLAEPTCDASAAIAERELAGQRLPGFFPTPAPVIRQMLALADMHDHHRVLEPSVGKGDIADAIRRKHPAVFLTVVEINRTLAELLTAKGYDPVFGDFLQFGSGEYYDRILMTPPFERGQDMAHIRHAYSLLATGGRLVAVMKRDTFVREDSHSQAFREWLRRVGGNVEALPPAAFRGTDAFQKTSIRTQLVVIDKP
jgi:phospholipid N-methyltransferase